MMEMTVRWYDDLGGGNIKARQGTAFHFLWDPNYKDLGAAVALIRQGEKILTIPVERLAIVDWAFQRS